MKFLESVPAIRRIDTDRDDLFAIDVVGHVSPADAENLFGLLEAAYALHPRIDVALRVIDHDGVDWAAISDETLKQGAVHALEHVGRCAAIGAPDWTADARHALPASSPIEFRHFSTQDEAEAWEWLGAQPLGGQPPSPT
ncbi:MAG: STAS/SEC14 domain-containing protein [Mesorhizobium sp.]|nr:STAS/SEC14 domain-containing protein [bacterium M00.F.Ca.ET.205.01.1.1]TGU53185.1 STAS/SEC14 domain-containing protein [bacterium M00.F.Ca.ET.152.01.1.1]TGV36160.1 STAS/SEC14 domain-containing protein [Mesorhizobium sp. M00.F.Ca.ET.186.01.1.1]TGZ43738.1 STAS/SEC14 domain-containing protein [bacterium M00.F.Ca.ET.162.01.1.1]TJW31798.1 MAG: STAS/SEC14 domain-containing protein [Mesorhizobium sp.]